MRKLLIFFVIAAGVAVFIWPTRWKVYDAGTGPYAEAAGPAPTRVDRLSGTIYAQTTSGEWKPLKGARPELLRPDITGPKVETRVDTGPAVQQGKSIERMQSQTEAMEAAVRAGAKH
jgi:hypothetical protein